MPKSSAVYSGLIDDSSMSLNSSRTSRREKNEERLAGQSASPRNPRIDQR
jgi:hypothetical protein